MSRAPDYDRILRPFVVDSVDNVILPGTKERLGGGYAGDVFGCRLRHPFGEEAVIKMPMANIILGWKQGRLGATNQRWTRQDSASNPGYYHLYNHAFPARVLTLRPASDCSRARLDLCELEAGSPLLSRQLWKIDDQGHLVSKFRSNLCLSISSRCEAEQGARLVVEQVRAGVCDRQAWSWQQQSTGTVLLASAFDDYVVDVAGDSDLRELCYLARWCREPGVVPLRYAVVADGRVSGATIVLKRLGKQLGVGTAPGGELQRCESVLRDIKDARMVAPSPVQAAQQMLAVASFLRRMHLEGHVHNDLHTGNVLRNGDAPTSPFSVIDLGAACEAGAWKPVLGEGYGIGWAITRDWRAFALNFLSLIDGTVRDIWRLIGTTNGLPTTRTDWAVPTSLQVAARAASGSKTQKWTVNAQTGEITSRSNGKVLDLSGEDDTTVIVYPAHGGTNQKWVVSDGTILNKASGKRLEISGGVQGSRIVGQQAAKNGEHQVWHYDEVSGEIVNPASRKVLDMAGDTRLPKDVQKVLDDEENTTVHAILAQLLDALFKARADPNEICFLIGLLANTANVAPGPKPALAVVQAPTRRMPGSSWGRVHEPWRGVNLGGWLLLEPGPSTGLFSRFWRKDGKQVDCEWALMEILRKKGALDALEQHRRTHITRDDFVQIKALGLNSVRLPFGYWIVTAPMKNTPYQGPALHYIDKALDWADEVGLEVVLDLHGCPGGESASAPCGRAYRHKSDWHWRQWKMAESLRVLEIVVARYKNRACVTGIEVCNEPSPTIPLGRLCRYYDAALSTIRRSGMSADRVAVMLPCFQRDLQEVVAEFEEVSLGRHRNYCWDMHYYHCFGWYHELSLGQHLAVVKEHQEEMRLYPVCVGEWSLALGHRASRSRSVPFKEACAIFARAQRQAYDEASHGWFFWNWKDSSGTEWDFRRALKGDDCLTSGLSNGSRSDAAASKDWGTASDASSPPRAGLTSQPSNVSSRSSPSPPPPPAHRLLKRRRSHLSLAAPRPRRPSHELHGGNSGEKRKRRALRVWFGPTGPVAHVTLMRRRKRSGRTCELARAAEIAVATVAGAVESLVQSTIDPAADAAEMKIAACESFVQAIGGESLVEGGGGLVQAIGPSAEIKLVAMNGDSQASKRRRTTGKQPVTKAAAV